MCFMLAEAYNEQGFPEKAVAEVNKVRARVNARHTDRLTRRLQHAYAKSAHANSPVKDSATGTSAAGACWRHR